MKTNFQIKFTCISVLLLLVFDNCKKDTPAVLPTVTVSAVTNVTANGATGGGGVTDDGGSAISSQGLCWAIAQNPTNTGAHIDCGTVTGGYSGQITGLNPGTTYYLRAYAINSVGVAYSDHAVFTTLALAPLVTTSEISGITSTTAKGGGNVTVDGGSAIFERGICWGIVPNPNFSNSKTSDGTGTGVFTSNLTGLLPATTYYVRAYATNSKGTTFGNQVTMTTNAVLPILTTATTTCPNAWTATSGGNITSDNGSAISARGVCWSIIPNPTLYDSKTSDGTGPGTFTSQITGLTANTTYYLRAYATNGFGTSYGQEITFSPGKGTATDIDGNVYNYLTIGTQTWMIENLKTTRFRDGSAIQNITGNTEWANLSADGYCWYNNLASNKDPYGALYNWFAVSDSRNLAPAGFHVATEAEWNTLLAFSGGESVAGGQLKETGTSHWSSPNTGAASRNGFSALPCGKRDTYTGSFGGLAFVGVYWTRTQWSTANAVAIGMNYDMISVSHTNYTKKYGFAVRCVKD